MASIVKCNYEYVISFMLSKVNSSAIVGLDAVPIEVEVDIASQGLPSFTRVGTQCQDLNSIFNFNFLLRGVDKAMTSVSYR